MGFMPVKHLADGSDAIYDYLGVPYPEGFMQQDSGLLFSTVKSMRSCLQGTQTKKETSLCLPYSRSSAKRKMWSGDPPQRAGSISLKCSRPMKEVKQRMERRSCWMPRIYVEFSGLQQLERPAAMLQQLSLRFSQTSKRLSVNWIGMSDSSRTSTVQPHGCPES